MIGVNDSGIEFKKRLGDPGFGANIFKHRYFVSYLALPHRGCCEFVRIGDDCVCDHRRRVEWTFSKRQRTHSEIGVQDFAEMFSLDSGDKM
jgi:hypothetical protein